MASLEISEYNLTRTSCNNNGIMKNSKRKQPITIEVVVGLLESSAHLDNHATEKRRSKEAKFGRATGQRIDLHGESLKKIGISGGYSIGIHLAAQMLASHAAELALKYAYESENPNQSAEKTHRLDILYYKLSQEKKDRIEADFAKRHGQVSEPGDGWKTAEEVFHSGKDYPVLFRYATEEGCPNFHVKPIFFRDAVCSVMASLGHNIRWGAM